ncbi:MAG: hypothetical protein Kow00121_25260 [Elainellaceae cyanobacterium]
MEKSIAIKLLSDTLQKPFDEAQFRQFARNLVNDLDESKAFQAQGNYIKDAYKQQVRQYKRIGQYVDPDENTIDVLVVRLQRTTSLDRARTMQRNFIAQYLQDRDQKEAALVAYTTDGSPDWRFSLVRLDYRLEQQVDGSYKPRKEVTAARRSSFLVGETEPNHTAQQQLLPLLLNDRQNPTLDELEAAFNIESVTKEFFERYKSLFLQVRDEVETLLQTDPVIATDFTQKQIDPANFAKKLLGQIVFLYFLQKKGWLGVEPGQPWGSGAKDFLRRLFDRENVQYDNFFNDVLEPLFYHALAVDRGSEALYELPGCQQPCKIPFLNGGLFEPIGGYDWQATNVLIANDTIQRIFDTFDLYNFTVREDEPLDKEVAVDPEMLGKVFENLLEVKDRKSKGAFYTPREIVHYMCQESLINYLDTTINRQSVEIAPPQAQQTSLFETSSSGQMPLTQEEYCERVPRGDLERLIRQGERAIENDAVVVQKGSETQTYQFQVPESVRTYAAEIDRALAAIKICDPAIGSGAFPVGMMQEIVKVRGVLTTYLPDEGRSAYAFKRHAIQSSIYGVDIDSGAVDIAKLRLWLSLVVDEEDYTRIKPLPNLDYKIVCGNSLLNVEKNLFNHQIFTELEQRKQEYFEETNPDRKTELRTTIHELIHTITNQDETFDFEVYFSEVFQQQGGFDVVIANPPYVGQKGNKTLFEKIRKGHLDKFYRRGMDVFYFFFHEAINLCKSGGEVCFITTNYFLTADGAYILRKDFKERTFVRKLINFNEVRLFNSATGQHNILSFLKRNALSKKVDQFTSIVVTSRKGDVSAQIINTILDGLDIDTDYLQKKESDLYDGSKFYIRITGEKREEVSLDPQYLNTDYLLGKIKNSSNKNLGDYCEITRGVESGADKVSEKHIFNKLVDSSLKGSGIYVLSEIELKSLNLSRLELEIVKPFFKNSDIAKYFCSLKPKKYLIYLTRDRDLSEYPTLEQHVYKFERIIKSRNANRGEMQAALRLGKWWVVRTATKNPERLKGAKIVCPQRSFDNSFAYNEIEWFSSADVYFISQKEKELELKYILALLNSDLYYFWLYYRGKRKGEQLELYNTPLSEIPLKEISKPEQYEFVKIVDQILELTRADDYLNNLKKNKLVESYQAHINQMVFDLYQFSADEIAVVKTRARNKKYAQS